MVGEFHTGAFFIICLVKKKKVTQSKNENQNCPSKYPPRCIVGFVSNQKAFIVHNKISWKQLMNKPLLIKA